MTTEEELINKFYTSFSESNPEAMTACYHKDVVFEDPAFGKLKGERAINMWKMLLSQKSGDIVINFNNIESNEKSGNANWTAEYSFGPKKRKVVNKVSAKFKFQDGKIIEHIDTFDFWTWSKQALGLPGLLLGWTPIMRNKVQKTTNERLDKFMKR